MQDAVDKISAVVERAVTESAPLLQGGGSGDQEYLVEQVRTHYITVHGPSIMRDETILPPVASGGVCLLIVSNEHVFFICSSTSMSGTSCAGLCGAFLLLVEFQMRSRYLHLTTMARTANHNKK